MTADHYPTSTGFTAIKTVNGETPTADQVFNFNLSEFKDNEWKSKETKTNNGSVIKFSDIQYSTDDEIGDHWYLISEDRLRSKDMNFQQNSIL